MKDYINLIGHSTAYYIAVIVLGVAVLLFKSRITAPLSVSVFVTGCVIGVVVSPEKVLLSVLCSLVLISVIYIKIKHPDLNYKKDVFSLGMLLNTYFPRRKDQKAIGRILPYNKFQLKHNKRMITFKDEFARGITMITGSTGSGKTHGILSLIAQDLDNGKRTAYIEYKGDEKVIKKLRKMAEVRGIPVYEFSNYKNDFDYDPLASLNKTGKIEALLNTRKWSMDGADAHYRTSTQLLIQKYINEFEGIYDEEAGVPYTVALYEFVRKQYSDKESRDAYSTLTKMLELLLTSDMKDVWYGNHGRRFDFSIPDQYLLIFSFVSSNKELANSVSSFVFKDILDTGTVKEYDSELALYVDECGTLENLYLIKDLLEKGRSCGIMTTISMQDINQVVINTNQAYLNSILGIVNTFIIYSGSTRITAEMIGGVQLYDIESIMVTLKKPRNGKPPTAMYISKYSTVGRNNSIDVYKIRPYDANSGNKESGSGTPTTRKTTIKIDRKVVGEPETTPLQQGTVTQVPSEPETKEFSKDDYTKFL